MSGTDITASPPTMSKEDTKEDLLVGPEIPSLLQQDVLIDLYIYADSIIAETFQNQIMDRLLKEMPGHRRFSYDVISRIYDNVCDNSPLRAIYVQAMAVQARSTTFKKVIPALPSDFIADVAVRKFEMEEGIGPLVPPFAASIKNNCAYHIHR
jgi:hypothetical protein